MASSLRNTPYDERLSALNMFFREKRRLRGKLIEVSKILDGFTNVDISALFEIDDTTRTRNNGTKLKCGQINSDCTKFFKQASFSGPAQLYLVISKQARPPPPSIFTDDVRVNPGCLLIV